VIRRLLISCCFVLLVSVRAEVSPASTADLSALTTTFDPENNAVTFSGQAHFSDGHTLLEADEIRYFYATNIAVATGHVRLTRGAERVLAEKITYRRSDHTFSIDRVRLGQFPFYIEGESASGDRQKITVHDATLSIREPGPFQPTITAKSLTYVNGQEVIAERAHLGIGSIRPVSLPHFSHRLNLPLVSYLSLNAGYRGSLGAFGQAGLHIPLGNETKLGGNLGVYTARGVMVGPSGHYELRPDDREISGDLRSGFINDHGDKLTDVLGRPVPENRGYVRWGHTQDLTDRLRLTAQFNYWKDSEILRDFKPNEFFAIQEPDNYVQAVYQGDNYYVTAFSRVQPNDFQRVQERLPEIRFDLVPLALGGGFYERFHASFAALREDSLGGAGPAVRSDRFDAYYGLSRPISRHDWFSFTPTVGARATHYTRVTGGKDNYTRILGEFGFDAELRASSVAEIRNAAWEINGLRHLITPKLSYRYVPRAARGRAEIPPIDRRSFSTYLPPIGLGDTRNLDDLVPTHVLRVGLDNTWQTRDADYGSRDLLVFNIANDFRFDREPGQGSASDLHSFIAFMPASWLQFDVYQRLATHDFALQELNTSLTIRDGDAWTLRFSSHFLHREIEEYIVQYDHRLNEAYAVVTKLHYDTRKRRFNEQAFGLRQNLSNTWKIEYLVTVYDGPRRESDFGFNIAVEALGF